MSDRKPFWSSAPGVVTGIASIVTAIVGLLGISVQAGWIGGDDNKASSSSGDAVATTTVTTVFGSAATTTVAVRTGEFTVDPDSLAFEPLKAKEATVTVENTGDVPLTMRKPTIVGSGAVFTVGPEDCTASALAPGRSCDVTVAFAADQPGEYTAKLVVAATNAPRQVEVDLKGTRSLLG